jgi:rfaE bifunctional protein kinase chain/domain
MDFTGLKVLVLGDICLDVVTDGECTRLSPECPVPVIKNPISTYSLGMVGNVALNLKNLGAQVHLYTGFYNDDAGEVVQELLLEHGLCTDFEFSECEVEGSTIVKERILANGHQIARIDIENYHVNAEDLAKDLENMYGHITFDLIVVSDYNKGLITKESWALIRPILENVKSPTGSIFVDTKKKDVLEYYTTTCLFPNSKELKEIMDFYSDKTIQVDINDLRVSLGSSLLIETASENGAYGHSSHMTYHSPTKAQEIIDICGAGDTFIAAFALYYTKHHNIQRALDFANYCCKFVIRHKGTVPVTYEEAFCYDLECTH